MKKTILSILFLCAACWAMAQTGRAYRTVPGDPLKARIYQLDNGLTVYLSDNKKEPRIQTYIAVRAGGKNDPAETTGLAHYLEHIMFKGTQRFGTSNFEAERPKLDSIRTLYEVYRQTTDPEQRRQIYHRIDSISYLGSTIAIANEYDKLMATIGADGTNAYTSNDVTCYTEDIPSNELENWAAVQSDRFQHMVVRGFHTELEAVYEEYNRSLTSDSRKLFFKMDQLLMPHHPYGKQTVLGTQDHLKNPSIVNIENFFHKYYVPNNVAICMSGDLDFDKTIDIIERYFGQWKNNGPAPAVETWPGEAPVTSPIVAEVTGLEAPMVALGWRFPGINDPSRPYLQIIQELIQNGKAGLFDLNILQQQKALTAQAFLYDRTDYSVLYALGMAKEGQTLDEVRALMLAEIEKIGRGEFDASLLEAIVNNLKLSEMRGLESNESRADKFVGAFVNRIDWADEVAYIDRLSALTKQQVVDFARQFLTTSNYACVYKRQGEDTSEKKIDKPAISPIEMNRDKTSDFVRQVAAHKPAPILPVFVDFDKDVLTQTLKNGNEYYYKRNTTNGRFDLAIRIERGNKADNLLGVAADYLAYLGTKRLSAEQLMSELYRLACSASVSTSDESTTLRVSGLAENEREAVRLLVDWLDNAQPKAGVYEALVDDILKGRELDKSNEQACYARLQAYALYGPHNSLTNIPSADALKAVDPQALLAKLRDLKNHHTTIFYYGPSAADEALALVNKYYKQPKQTLPAPADNYFELQNTPECVVYLAPYESKAIRMGSASVNGEVLNAELVPAVRLFNEYFGGGMNTIVFQELREARGLAYQASASYGVPSRKGGKTSFSTFIISQNDKMGDCLDVFHNIIEQMPASDTAFPISKESLVKSIATQRVEDGRVAAYVFDLRRRGYDHDWASDIYREASRLTLADVQRFAREHVSGRTYSYFILGDASQLDQKKLESIGRIQRLSLEDIFGY
jgi:predicted Zn-dependent peptidase